MPVYDLKLPLMGDPKLPDVPVYGAIPPVEGLPKLPEAGT
jgi:hypothetical protein